MGQQTAPNPKILYKKGGEMSRKVGQNKPTQKQTCSLTNPCKNKPSTDKPNTNTNLHANNLHANPHTNNYYIYKANKNRSHTKNPHANNVHTNLHTNKRGYKQILHKETQQKQSLHKQTQNK